MLRSLNLILKEMKSKAPDKKYKEENGMEVNIRQIEYDVIFVSERRDKVKEKTEASVTTEVMVL